MGKRGTKHVNKRKLKSREELERAFLQRFWTYVDKAGPDECWLWNKSCTAAGYGQIWRVDNMFYAHRVSYELTHGPIPDGLDILHSCDNPPCCNPAHLRAGTAADNARDMLDRGRHWAPPIGTVSPNRKLTPEQVRFIRAHAGKIPKQRMAKQHGVAPFVVDLLLKGLSYKEVV